MAQMERTGIPPEQGMPAVLGWGDVELQRALDVTDSSLLRALRITKKGLLDVDWEGENEAGRESLPQALGLAALMCGYEGLLVPSAAAKARNLVIFPQALRVGSRVKAHGLKGLP